MRPRPNERVHEGTEGASPLPDGFRRPGETPKRHYPKPQPPAPPESLSCAASLTLMRGDSTARAHVLWLRVEVERGSNAAARLCEIAEQGRMRGVAAVVDATANGMRIGGGA